ncbi:MAG: YceD family protein, partial [Pyrinomonadaceae bacterium]
MIIELSSLDGNSKKLDIEIAESSINLDEDSVKLSAPVRFVGEVSRSGNRTDIDGKIDAKLEVECSRCLEPVLLPLEFDFRSRFMGVAEFEKSSDGEVELNDLDTDFVEGEKLDISNLIREQLLLNVPEQVFCQKNCFG